MRIQHNIMAMNAYRNYNNNTSALSKNLEKLSSGYKINRAGDDAAGLAISEKMRAQITGLNAAQKNVKDGISLVKTAEGAMQEIQDMLNRMDYLATQSANGTYDNEVDRANLQKEVDALRTEIDRIADSANFNGIKLLNGDQASEAAASTSTVSVNVTPAVTAGAAITPAVTMTGASTVLAGNFAPSNNVHGGLHPGEASASYVAPSFSISLKDLTISGVTSATGNTDMDKLTITIGDGNITISVNDTAGDGLDGSEVAALLNGKDISIGGVTFAMKVDGTDNFKINFTVSSNSTADGNAAAVNAQIKGNEVKIGIADTDVAGDVPSINDNWTHGLQDITLAVDTKAADLGGISFKLDDKVVADGNKLIIGDKTYVFSVGDNSAVTSVATGETKITIKDGDYAEAARQIAQSATDITDTDATKGGKFKVSSVGTDTIHIDQQAPATGEAPAYDADALKGLFTVVKPAVDTAVKASVTLTPGTIDTGVAEGDMVSYGDTTYTIGTAPEGAKNADSYMTAASFNAMVQTDTVNKLKAAAEKEFGTDNYNITVADGKVKIEAKNGNAADTSTVLNAKVDAIKNAVSSVSISKIDAANVGKGGLKLQIGDTSDPFNQMSVKIGDMHVDAMGTMKDSDVEGGSQTVVTSIADIDISSQDGAAAAVDVIKNAINYVSGIRGDLGAIQNRLEHTQNNLSVMAENIQDAESTIRDTDVAEEMMSYVKNNILVQSAQAMLAQANQVPQGVLQLLG